MKRVLAAICIFAISGAAQAAPATQAPAAPSKGDRYSVISSSNDFSTDLYLRLSREDRNILFSPPAVFMQLAMAYAGTDGLTAQEMSAALHTTLPQQRLHPALGEMLKSINYSHKDFSVLLVNGMWLQSGYAYSENFKTLVRPHLSTSQSVDFYRTPEAARATANEWYERQLGFKGIVKEDSFNQNTRLALVSTAVFNGDWAQPFDIGSKQDKFKNLNGSSADVPMMRVRGNFNYMSDKGSVQVLELPYKNNEFTLVVFLPDASSSLTAFEQNLTGDKVGAMLTRLRKLNMDLEVYMPKFSMMESSQLRLPLWHLGIKSAFEPNADFSRLFTPAGPYLSSVLHVAQYGIAENVSTNGSVPVTRAGKPVATVRVDRPFMFMVREVRSGAAVMLGRIINLPASNQ